MVGDAGDWQLKLSSEILVAEPDCLSWLIKDVALKHSEVSFLPRGLHLGPEALDRQAEQASHPFFLKVLVHCVGGRTRYGPQFALSAVEVERQDRQPASPLQPARGLILICNEAV